MGLEVEVWESTHNRKEKHYFVQDGKQHGYQCDGAYLFGINPQLVSDDQERRILEILGFENGK